MNVLTESCAQCPFIGGIPLAPGRLRSIIETTKRRDCEFTCHKSLHLPRKDAAVCGGWYKAVHLKTGAGQLVRIMGRMRGLRMISVEEAIAQGIVKNEPADRHPDFEEDEDELD